MIAVKRALLVLFSTLFFTVSCGQQGPLVLPDSHTEQTTQQHDKY